MKYKRHLPARDCVYEGFCNKTCLGQGKLRHSNVKNDSSEKCVCNKMIPLRSCKVSLRRMEKSSTVRQQRKNKSQLNPVVKNYVRELLDLNKEGLKAIEIAALQCSSVTTPGSSIMNEPSNKFAYEESDCNNIMLTKLDKNLNQKKVPNTYKKNYNKSISVSSENNTQKPSKVFVRKQVKKKYTAQTTGHKIKNLNISKTLLNTKRSLKNQKKKLNSLASDDSSDNNAMKIVSKGEDNPQSKTHRPKGRSLSSPSPRITDHLMLKKAKKTSSDTIVNENKHFISNKANSGESHSEKKTSRHNLIPNETAKLDNITVTAAPDKITIILKPPIEMKSMTKQVLSNVFDKSVQTQSKGEITSDAKGIETAAASATQKNWDKNQESELIKFAQNKLHNMEQIASLTDKCTKRLSNLARVLEEVRKSKSTAYSHISTTDTSSESELKTDKNIQPEKSKLDLGFNENDNTIEAKKQLLSASLEGNNEKKHCTENDLHSTKRTEYSHQSTHTAHNIKEKNGSKCFEIEIDRKKVLKLREQSLTSVATNTEGIENIFLSAENRFLVRNESQSTAINTEQAGIPINVSINTERNVMIANNEEDLSTAVNTEQLENNDYVPMLSDIPRPLNLPSNSFLNKEVTTHDVCPSVQPEVCNRKFDSHHCDATGRSKSKPPPALSRVTLKKSDEILVPHELSTVIEVDSPMSMKYKKQSPTHASDSKLSHSETMNDEIMLDNDNEKKTDEAIRTGDSSPKKHDLVEKKLISEIMRDSSQLKMKMMNLTKFNEIMLKPFITMEEYAKQCNVSQLDEGSNHEDLSRAATIDEISSLNSDASMPDIVSELLKRNVISEPFHFDSASHPNSTTVSSESSLPIFALSKATKEKLKSKTAHRKKDRVIVSETSDSLSISSYPDLEKAFKNFGIGWASSTLKKTKQTLCLSSSTNTSNSSTSNKYSPKKCDNAVQVSQKNVNNKKVHNNKQSDKTKQSAGQQASATESVMDNEFLVRELADRMTLSTKGDGHDSEEHFTSLYSTKLPSETNLQVTYPPSARNSEENGRANTRQRTSTPVPLFKSKSYNSSSSSNNRSDGLFSNTDELSSVKLTSSSVKNHSSSEKDELTIPNCSLRVNKDNRSDGS